MTVREFELQVEMGFESFFERTGRVPDEIRCSVDLYEEFADDLPRRSGTALCELVGVSMRPDADLPSRTVQLLRHTDVVETLRINE